MKQIKTWGFTNLIKKSLSIISASLALLFNNNAEAKLFDNNNDDANLDIDNIRQKVLKSKLVLKLNASNLDNSKLMMHSSHSSHSSHRSHSSHSSHISSSSPGHSSHASHVSHSSHYSSSPTYVPSSKPSELPAVPITKPGSPVVVDTTKKSDNKPSGFISNPLPVYVLGSRILFKGCRGTDVRALQQLLINLGYEIVSNGYFDEATKLAVIDFQILKNLNGDGKVGPQTLSAIKNQ